MVRDVSLEIMRVNNCFEETGFEDVIQDGICEIFFVLQEDRSRQRFERSQSIEKMQHFYPYVIIAKQYRPMSDKRAKRQQLPFLHKQRKYYLQIAECGKLSRIITTLNLTQKLSQHILVTS